MSQQTTVGIFLAAGFGRRFDPSGVRNKLTELLDSGIPVAVKSANTACSVLDTVIAVAHCPVLAQRLNDAGCRSVIFGEAEAGQGMGASLAFGVSYILAHFPQAQSLLVVLADMPYLQTATYHNLLAELDRGAQIVQPVFSGQTGHPVGFSSSYFPALAALSGDMGARRLLLESSVTRVSVEDPGCLQDIDYLSDLRTS